MVDQVAEVEVDGNDDHGQDATKDSILGFVGHEIREVIEADTSRVSSNAVKPQSRTNRQDELQVEWRRT